MYDELVKDLREATGWKNASVHYSLMNEAADAIEELSHDYEKLAEDFNGAVELLHKREKPRWISVEERLPEKKVGDEGYVGYLVLSDGEYQIADFTNDKYMQTAYEFHVDGEYDPNVTHWMELPPKEPNG